MFTDQTNPNTTYAPYQHPNPFPALGQASIGNPHLPNLNLGGVDPSALFGMAQGMQQGRTQRGLNYANMRLNQLAKIASLTGDQSFMGLFGHINGAEGGGPTDPTALWGQASGQFAGLAKQAGYADPRMYLQLLLNKARTNAGPGGAVY